MDAATLSAIVTLCLFGLACIVAFVCLLILIWQDIQYDRKRNYRRRYRRR